MPLMLVASQRSIRHGHTIEIGSPALCTVMSHWKVIDTNHAYGKLMNSVEIKS